MNLNKTIVSLISILFLMSLGAAGELSNPDYTFDGHTDSVVGVAVDSDGNVYSASSDETVKKIDSSGTEVWTFTGHTHNVYTVAVDSDGNVYSGSFDDTVKKIDSSGNDVWTFNGHTDTVQGVAVDSNGNVYSASRDDTVKKIDSSGNEIWTFTGHTDRVWSVDVDSNDNVYSASYDGSVRKINSSGNEMWSFTGHTNRVYDVAVDTDGNVYSGSEDNSVKKIDSNGNEVWTYTGHTDRVDGVAVDTNGNVYSASQDESVKKIDSSGSELDSFSVDDDTAYSVGISPLTNDDEQFLAVGTSYTNNLVYRWTQEVSTSIASYSSSADLESIIEFNSGTEVVNDSITIKEGEDTAVSTISTEVTQVTLDVTVEGDSKLESDDLLQNGEPMDIGTSGEYTLESPESSSKLRFTRNSDVSVDSVTYQEEEQSSIIDNYIPGQVADFSLSVSRDIYPDQNYDNGEFTEVHYKSVVMEGDLTTGNESDSEIIQDSGWNQLDFPNSDGSELTQVSHTEDFAVQRYQDTDYTAVVSLVKTDGVYDFDTSSWNKTQEEIDRSSYSWTVTTADSPTGPLTDLQNFFSSILESLIDTLFGNVESGTIGTPSVQDPPTGPTQ